MKGLAGRVAALALLVALPGWTMPPAEAGADQPSAGSGAGGGSGTTATSTTTPTTPDRAKPGLNVAPGMEALTLAGPVNPDEYRIGPGDVLLVQLWGKVSRSLTLEVGPEGMILVPGARGLSVGGLTLTEVRKEILDLMRDQFRGVSMDVTLARPRVFRVYLTGQVTNPGPTVATGASRIADVLAPSGLLPKASTRRIELIHHDGTRELADLGLFLATGRSELNPWLRDGDVISVPVATEFIHVQGAVARPDDYELGSRDSLITLLRMAGDPIPAAYLDRALLIRWQNPLTPESLWVNLEDIYARRVNPPLEDGARFYVYFVPQYRLQMEAAIVGEVQQPGTYPITEGRTHLSDLVTAAQGFLPSADMSSIRVHRRSLNAQETDPELDRLLRLSRNELTTSEYVVLRTKLASLREDYRVDWNRLVQEPAQLDLLLRGGDVVRVERLVQSVRVDGEVRRPGIMTFKPGLAWVDYVEQAGGFTDRAWVGKTRVTRAANGQTLPANSVHALSPGDFVWVPEKPDITAWQQAQTLLASLAYAATILIAIRTIR